MNFLAATRNPSNDRERMEARRQSIGARHLFSSFPGLDPAIDLLALSSFLMDARVKPAHDGSVESENALACYLDPLLIAQPTRHLAAALQLQLSQDVMDMRLGG